MKAAGTSPKSPSKQGKTIARDSGLLLLQRIMQPLDEVDNPSNLYIMLLEPTQRSSCLAEDGGRRTWWAHERREERVMGWKG